MIGRGFIFEDLYLRNVMFTLFLNKYLVTCCYCQLRVDKKVI